MHATAPRVLTLLGTALFATTLHAAPYCSPVFKTPLCVAPDACGPGFYSANCQGTVFGPNYWLVPPTGPFNGYHKAATHSVGQQIMGDRLGIPGGPGPYGPGPYGPHAYGQGAGPYPGPGGPPPGLPYPGYNPNFPPPPGGMPGLPNPGYAPNLPALGGLAPHMPPPGYAPNLFLPMYSHPGQSPSAFPTHPYVRSPRDFFMWRENMEDQMRREQRPALIP